MAAVRHAHPDRRAMQTLALYGNSPGQSHMEFDASGMKANDFPDLAADASATKPKA
jgi:hypothetical protein